MATGKVHHEIWKKFTAEVTIASLAGTIFGWPSLVGPFIAVGYYLQAIMGPDLDMVQKTYNEKLLIEKAGPLGWLWMAYWIPYAGLCYAAGGHRCWLSHWPILGTLVRLFYLMIPYIVWSAINLVWPSQLVLDALLGMLIGLTIGDTLHLIYDYKEAH